MKFQNYVNQDIARLEREFHQLRNDDAIFRKEWRIKDFKEWAEDLGA